MRVYREVDHHLEFTAHMFERILPYFFRVGMEYQFSYGLHGKPGFFRHLRFQLAGAPAGITNVKTDLLRVRLSSIDEVYHGIEIASPENAFHHFNSSLDLIRIPV